MSTSWTEEELWLRLDGALGGALVDPVSSWDEAYWVWRDSADFPDVRRAADRLMSVLLGPMVAVGA